MPFKPVLKKYAVGLTLALVLFDVGCVVAAFFLSAAMLGPLGAGARAYAGEHLAYFIVFTIVWLGVAIDQRLFVSQRSEPLVPQLFVVAKAVFYSLLISGFLVALIVRPGMDREFVGLFSLLLLVFIVTFRLLARLGLWGLRRRGFNYRHILLIGANERSSRVAETILSHAQYGYDIVGYLDDDEGRGSYFGAYRIPYLGKIHELERILSERIIDVVYVSLPVRSYYETIRSATHLCEGVGVPVRLIADLFPIRMATSEMTRLRDIPLLGLTSRQHWRMPLDLQRLIELAVATFLLIILMPAFVVIGLLVKLDSAGGVFVRESRMDPRSQRRFYLYKFRTVPDVRAPGAPAASEGAVGSVATTRIGQYLRRYSLDELPALVNVWLGQMSFTEARPQLVSDAASAPRSGSTPPGSRPTASR